MSLLERDSVDVLVAGGGPAGIIAALAAARTGARTMLVERLGHLGGVAALGSIGYAGFFNNRYEQIVRGIPWEFASRLLNMKGALVARNSSIGGTDGRGGPRFNAVNIYVLPEAVKFVAYQMLRETGVEILLHSFVTDAVLEGNAVRGIVVENKSGESFIPAQRVIDCTGDGDVAARAGAQFEKGRAGDGLMQPMTPLFVVTRIDVNKGVQAGTIFRNPYEADSEYWQERWGSYMVRIDQWSDELKAEFPEYRFHRFSFRDFGIGAYYCGNMIHIAGHDSTDSVQLSSAEIEAKLLVWRLVHFLREYVPGFEECQLVSTPALIGIRESRRILGQYYLTLDDVLEAREFEDTIALCGYWADIHQVDGGPDLTLPAKGTQVKGLGAYGIPYRSLVPQTIESLLIAGRCISGSHEAHASYRVMGTAMAMGHAAGAAAALSLEQSVEPSILDTGALQRELLGQGAYLGERHVQSQLTQRSLN